MKIWSPLLASVLVLAGVYAQYEDDGFHMEMFTDDFADDDVGFTEVRDGPLPCNGFPEYRKLPINQAFYLGAHNAGSHVFNESCQGTQTKDITQMLTDGIRYLDINLCRDEQGKAVICSTFDSATSALSFADVLESVLQFSRDNVEQFVVVNIKSENVKHPVNTKELEALIDERCKIHTELTAGTDEYKVKECPFIETYVPGKSRWRSMGEIVNYDPEMAQWVGDGELVGVRTKILFTLADTVVNTADYKSSYFTPAFWRSIHKDNKIADLDSLKKLLGKQCRIPAGGIGLEAYASAACSEEFNAHISSPIVLEDILTSRSGCNLNDSPLNTFFSFVSVDHYDKQLPYLKDLEERMMQLNFEKWSGNYKPLSPSTLKSTVEKEETQHILRDEL
ncbi:unnamed protein product [Mucor hiemalis]